MQHTKLFAYVNNNIHDIKRILQDKQFHLQLKSEQKEIIQNVLERKDSMAVLPTGFGKSISYVECKSNRPTAKSPPSISPPHLSKLSPYKIAPTLIKIDPIIKIMKKLI
jgi:hypothetical protein